MFCIVKRTCWYHCMTDLFLWPLENKHWSDWVMNCCVVCCSVNVPITAAVCVGLKSEHRVVASGTEHTNADRCLSYGRKTASCSVESPLCVCAQYLKSSQVQRVLDLISRLYCTSTDDGIFCCKLPLHHTLFKQHPQGSARLLPQKVPHDPIDDFHHWMSLGVQT